MMAHLRMTHPSVPEYDGEKDNKEKNLLHFGVKTYPPQATTQIKFNNALSSMIFTDLKPFSIVKG